MVLWLLLGTFSMVAMLWTAAHKTVVISARSQEQGELVPEYRTEQTGEMQLPMQTDQKADRQICIPLESGTKAENVVVENCEDVDEQVLSYAEVKALCAGDDRIKEKMDLEVEVAKLRLLKSEYQSTQYQLEDRLLKRYPEQIKKKEAQIAGIKADQKTAEQHPKSENVFCGIEVFGKEYTDKKRPQKLC